MDPEWGIPAVIPRIPMGFLDTEVGIIKLATGDR